MPVYTSGTSSAPLPDGEYRAEIEQAKLKDSKNSGNKMIEMWLRLPRGGMAIDNLVFVKSAFWKIDQFREALGEIILPDEEIEVNPSELVGRKPWVSVKTETFEGKARNKIASYLPPKPGDSDDDDIEATAEPNKPESEDNLPGIKTE